MRHQGFFWVAFWVTSWSFNILMHALADNTIVGPLLISRAPSDYLHFMFRRLLNLRMIKKLAEFAGDCESPRALTTPGRIVSVLWSSDYTSNGVCYNWLQLGMNRKRRMQQSGQGHKKPPRAPKHTPCTCIALHRSYSWSEAPCCTSHYRSK